MGSRQPTTFFGFKKKEAAMDKHLVNYDTLIKVTRAISMSKDPEEIAILAVNSIKRALSVKGVTLFLVNRKTQELEVAASTGLSQEYLEKGPVSAIRSIADSLDSGPIAIYNVTDDPRLQYPQEAVKEGIASILSVPIEIHGQAMGALRVYTSEPWEFVMGDVSMVQAVGQMVGMALDMARLTRGYKSSIEVLKTMRDPSRMKPPVMEGFEGLPV
jgi:GAF domain-containing protein